MPRYDVTFIFDMPKHGFSEKWSLTNDATNLDVIRDKAAIVAAKRALLMGDGCTMQAVRISNGDDPGRVGKTYAMVYTGNAQNGAMASNVAINCQFGTFDNQYQKIVQVRGGWDNWETNGGALNPTGELTGLFQGWLQALISQEFGFRSIVSRSGFMVTGYTVSPQGAVLVTCIHPTPGTTLFTAVGPAGTKKSPRFAEVNGKSRLNGVQVIRVVDATHVELVKPLALTEFVSPGKVTFPSFTTRMIANGTVQRLGKRQAGAPLLASRGRGPVRVRI